MKIKYLLLALPLCLIGCNNAKEKNADEKAIVVDVDTNNDQEYAEDEIFNISPISHATMVLNWDGKTIYVDPVGGGEVFLNESRPDVILITDIHGDHLNTETVQAVIQENTTIIAPQAVADKLPEAIQKMIRVLNNGEDAKLKEIDGFNFSAIPMYNLREEALKFHEKGRGNGYVIEHNKKRIYISGDTEDIPEMRNLKKIDIAFVCMNLPYTMTVDSAASAVLDFKPKTVYPYHYRGTEGLSDVSNFKKIVTSSNPEIKVTQLDWYPNREE